MTQASIVLAQGIFSGSNGSQNRDCCRSKQWLKLNDLYVIKCISCHQ